MSKSQFQSAGKKQLKTWCADTEQREPQATAKWIQGKGTLRRAAEGTPGLAWQCIPCKPCTEAEAGGLWVYVKPVLGFTAQTLAQETNTEWKDTMLKNITHFTSSEPPILKPVGAFLPPVDNAFALQTRVAIPFPQIKAKADLVSFGHESTDMHEQSVSGYACCHEVVVQVAINIEFPGSNLKGVDRENVNESLFKTPCLRFVHFVKSSSSCIRVLRIWYSSKYIHHQ